MYVKVKFISVSVYTTDLALEKPSKLGKFKKSIFSLVRQKHQEGSIKTLVLTSRCEPAYSDGGLKQGAYI